MAPTVKQLEGYEELKTALNGLNDGDKPVFVLLCGSKDASGNSWCPDCVTADPIVHESAREKLKDGLLLCCQVGPREFWKDAKNPFRTDPKLKVTAVPTLIAWDKGNRLVEEQLFRRDLVDMLFEDDD